MAYQVRLEHFEGPLDLLLFLIREHEVDIYDIPISLVTQQYLQYLELLKLLDLEVGSEYLLMAATLLRIKSKMLLPRRPEEEEEEGADPREELVQRLLEYRQFKEAAGVLNEHQDRNADVFYHPPAEQPEEDLNGVETLDTRLAGNLNLWDLLQAFKFTLDRSKDDFDRTVERETLSIEDRMDDILDHLKRQKNFLQSALPGGSLPALSDYHLPGPAGTDPAEPGGFRADRYAGRDMADPFRFGRYLVVREHASCRRN